MTVQRNGLRAVCRGNETEEEGKANNECRQEAPRRCRHHVYRPRSPAAGTGQLPMFHAGKTSPE